MEVIKDKAKNNHSFLFRYNSEFSSEMLSDAYDRICFDYHGNKNYTKLELPLAGEHQLMNASIAVKVIEIILEKYPYMRFDIRKGLTNVKWPGRLEIIKKNPLVLVDGAHNPSAAGMLSKYLQKFAYSQFRRIIMVIGIMGDKDINGILAPLLPVASEIIFTSPSYGRAATTEMLAGCAASMGFFSRRSLNVADALKIAEELYLPGDVIVVTGSFYTIGELKENLGQKGILASLRECKGIEQ
jgi:dihydrofolate synthase/folylpolyglutamate synthase